MAWTTPQTWTSGNVLTAAQLNEQVRDNLDALAPNGPTYQDYVPALTASTTNPTLGTGSAVAGRYLQIGEFVHVSIVIIFGTSGTNAGSGSYRVSVPIAMANPGTAFPVVGHGRLTDASTGALAIVSGIWQASTVVALTTGAVVADNVPWAWAASDSIRLTLSYEAA